MTTVDNKGDNGTAVARGQHIVPKGVAVLEFLDGQHERLSEPVPDSASVKNLLETKKLLNLYKEFIGQLVKRGKTYVFSNGQSQWLESKMVSVVKEWSMKFAKSGIKLVFCMLHSECGNYRWFWLEFIDFNLVPDDYTPKYDTATNYRLVMDGYHMIPTTGVEVHELLDYKSVDKFTKGLSPDLEEFLQARNLTDPYHNKLIQAIGSSKNARTWTDTWKTTEVLQIVKNHEMTFEEHNVEISVCKRPIGVDFCKWLELVDVNTCPTDYVPMHSVDTEKRKEASQRFFAVRRAKQGVAVEDLVVDGEPKLSEQCPSEVQELLEQRGKGLVEDYQLLDQAISEAKSLRNFCDIWRMTEQGVIQFPVLDEFRSKFLAQNVKILLCESVGKSGRNYWLEYVDLETNPNYTSPFSVNYSTDVLASTKQKSSSNNMMMDKDGKTYRPVIGGRHRVPAEGVAIQEITDTTKLTDECTAEVKTLLEQKGLLEVYDKCVKSIVSSKSTRNWASNWNSAEIAAVLQQYESEFTKGGIRVAMCKLKPPKGTSFRWLEFIDTQVAAGYVPQYDVTSFEEELETASSNTTLQFPKGVVVEKLMDRKTVMETMPPAVKALMERKDCLDLYNALVDILCHSVVGEHDYFSEANMKELTNTLGPKFEAKGVSVFLSSRPEIRGTLPLCWVEFVDRELQPNYIAQHGVGVEQMSGKGMSKQEVFAMTGEVVGELMEEVLLMMVPLG